MLEIPSALSAAWEETLRQLSLNLSKKIEVWPAGLAAAAWDGEGRGEWLASEQPCLGICADHAIDALNIGIGDTLELAIDYSRQPPGAPVFVELPRLAIGLHNIRIKARHRPESDAEDLGELEVVMRVREAQPWSPGINRHGALSVSIEPVKPTLEQLWEGQVDISFQGPRDRKISCKVSLLERLDAPAKLIKILPPLSLPVTPAIWRLHFQQYFRKLEDVEAAYDIARVCALEFNAEELGRFSLTCEREFVPLRWALRRENAEWAVQLFDDTGNAGQPVITHYDFETPIVPRILVSSLQYIAPSEGGMYLARTPNAMRAIIVPPRIRQIRGFADLGCSPRIDGGVRSPQTVAEGVKMARLWGEAKLPGSILAVMRRREVLLAFVRYIVRLLCGEDWIRAEDRLPPPPSSCRNLGALISNRPHQAAIGAVIDEKHVSLATDPREERVRVLSAIIAAHFNFGSAIGPTNDPLWLTELAVRLVSYPVNIEPWAGGNLAHGITRLCGDLSVLVRAARYLVIATDRDLRSQGTSEELYAGWGSP
jgi:hypothetical protein